jgi:hypothetical protein
MATILVCAAVGHFADDVHTTCRTCGTPIDHRPHVPPDAVPMCMACAFAAVKDSPMPPEIRVTKKTLLEVVLYEARTKGTQ